MNLRKIITRVLVAGIILALPRANASSPPDLASPSQAVRDAAAALARESFKTVEREHWLPLCLSLKTGDTRGIFFEKMGSLARTPTPGFTNGQDEVESYRLDDLWVLECRFDRFDQRLLGCTLNRAMNSIWVEPPPHFSGVWTTYFANGQKAYELRFTDGRRLGEFRIFREDGSLSGIQEIGPNGVTRGIGYYPSGAVANEATYAPDGIVGTHYNEDGSVHSTVNTQHK